MMYAHVVDGVVAEIIPAELDGVPLADRYHPDVVASLVPAPAEVSPGWTLDMGAWLPPAPMPVDTVALSATLRGERDQLLLASDWTEGDRARLRIGAEKAEAWDTYRQALRDLPLQAGFPAEIVWPLPPA